MESNKKSCCGGCRGGDVSLTKEELDFLLRFCSLPFLPFGAKAAGLDPVFYDGFEKISETLTWLMLKGLISLDYDIPLKNYDYAEYSAYPVHGSMALTARGQAALDAYEIQGVSE